MRLSLPGLLHRMRHRAGSPRSAPEGRRRHRILLTVIAAALVLADAFSLTVGSVSKSAYLLRSGLIGIIPVLAFLGLLLFLRQVAARRAAGGAGKTPEAPVSDDRPTGHEGIAPTTPADTSTATALPPQDVAGPLVQRKDFARRQHRPLTSHHSACSLDQAGTDRLFILAGSVLGAGHDQAGTTREDDVAFAAAPTSTNMVLAAVADGVGSARLSHIASALAVRRAIELLDSLLPDESHLQGLIDPRTWSQLADQLVERIAIELTEERISGHRGDLGMPPVSEESYHRHEKPSTTLAVLAVEDTTAGSYVWWLTVGDCEVAVADIADRELKYKYLTPRTERDGQLTPAVPSMRRASNSGQLPLYDGQAVLAMTDGAAEVLDARPEHLLRALAAARQGGSALCDLLVALDLRVHAAHDDRSVVAVGQLLRG